MNSTSSYVSLVGQSIDLRRFTASLANHALDQAAALSGANHVLILQGRRHEPEHHVLVVVGAKVALAGIHVTANRVRGIPCVAPLADDVLHGICHDILKTVEYMR